MKKNIDYKELADNLLDYFCEAFSPNECIDILKSMGYSKEGLLELGFDKSDIE